MHRAPDERGRDPTPAELSASESTIERQCTNVAAPRVGGTLGTPVSIEVRLATR